MSTPAANAISLLSCYDFISSSLEVSYPGWIAIVTCFEFILSFILLNTNVYYPSIVVLNLKIPSSYLLRL
jgi:hypothetical protein